MTISRQLDHEIHRNMEHYKYIFQQLGVEHVLDDTFKYCILLNDGMLEIPRLFWSDHDLQSELFNCLGFKMLSKGIKHPLTHWLSKGSLITDPEGKRIALGPNGKFCVFPDSMRSTGFIQFLWGRCHSVNFNTPDLGCDTVTIKLNAS